MTDPIVIPARRLRLRTKDSATSFSVPAGIGDREAIEAHRAFALRIAKGHARRIICFDGAPGRPKWDLSSGLPVKVRPPIWEAGILRVVWAARCAMSYVAMWLTIIHRATFGRHLVLAEMKRLDAGRWETI